MFLNQCCWFSLTGLLNRSRTLSLSRRPERTGARASIQSLVTVLFILYFYLHLYLTVCTFSSSWELWPLSQTKEKVTFVVVDEVLLTTTSSLVVVVVADDDICTHKHTSHASIQVLSQRGKIWNVTTVALYFRLKTPLGRSNVGGHHWPKCSWQCVQMKIEYDIRNTAKKTWRPSWNGLRVSSARIDSEKARRIAFRSDSTKNMEYSREERECWEPVLRRICRYGSEMNWMDSKWTNFRIKSQYRIVRNYWQFPSAHQTGKLRGRFHREKIYMKNIRSTRFTTTNGINLRKRAARTLGKSSTYFEIRPSEHWPQALYFLAHFGVHSTCEVQNKTEYIKGIPRGDNQQDSLRVRSLHAKKPQKLVDT